MTMNNTNHRGFIGRPGAINAGISEAIRLPIGSLAQSQLEAALLERAQGPGEIRWAIRKEKPKQSTASEQRKAWAQLIASANPNRR
jgi:hypothetical protein